MNPLGTTIQDKKSSSQFFFPEREKVALSSRYFLCIKTEILTPKKKKLFNQRYDQKNLLFVDKPVTNKLGLKWSVICLTTSYKRLKTINPVLTSATDFDIDEMPLSPNSPKDLSESEVAACIAPAIALNIAADMDTTTDDHTEDDLISVSAGDSADSIL